MVVPVVGIGTNAPWRSIIHPLLCIPFAATRRRAQTPTRTLMPTIPDRWRLALLVAALLAAGGLLLAQQAQPGAGLAALDPRDFYEYWAAGRLLLEGRNPYDLEAMEQVQREAGREADPILMWNPPWALPLVLPLGLLDLRSAHLVWLVFHLLVLIVSADLAWRLYGGPPQRRWVAQLLAATFVPTWMALIVGQIAPLLLLGAVGFLWCLQRGWDLTAGAAAVLLAIKPHLAALFWVALALWAVREGRWRVLLGGVTTGLFATGLAILAHPAVLGRYLATLTTRPPDQYRPPTLGQLLRLALDSDSLAWGFLPLIPALGWLGWHWARRRDWNWPEELPLLLLVSMLVAPYGAWPFDVVLLLLPVLQLGAAFAREGVSWLPRLAALGFHVVFNAAGLALLLLQQEYLTFAWMTPVLLLGYLGLRTLRYTNQPQLPGPRDG
jgi:hypothetical protein